MQYICGLIIAKCKGKEQSNADRPALNGGPFGGPSAGQVRTVLGENTLSD